MYRQQTELSNNIAQADIDEAILGSRCCCTTSIYIPYSPCAPSVLPPAFPCSLGAPLLRLFAPPLLPLKPPCSLFRTETAILNPRIGVNIMYRFPELSATRDPLLTHASLLCSRARARFATLLSRCSPILPLCFPMLPLSHFQTSSGVL